MNPSKTVIHLNRVIKILENIYLQFKENFVSYLLDFFFCSNFSLFVPSWITYHWPWTGHRFDERSKNCLVENHKLREITQLLKLSEIYEKKRTQ